jgi:filamentous hemagglutinin family protein
MNRAIKQIKCIQLLSSTLACCVLASNGVLATPLAIAQIIPDRTLPNNSRATSTNNITVINGGTQVGNNLFHSFERFDIPTKAEAIFNNPKRIENIFTRVTGNNISKIDGIITTAGKANLFFINPNGIVFGKDARLNIGGSFFASTASDIKFANGTEFSAETPQAAPLLTISAPIGLGLGTALGSITIEGNGHDLSVVRPVSTPLNRNTNNTGLQVQPGKTLALVGNNLDITGGILTAPGGKIELVSALKQSYVNINTGSEFTLSYSDNSNLSANLANIELSKQSLIDVSGINAGSVQLFGRQINLRDGSVVWAQNQGSRNGGNINVYAADSLNLIGTTTSGRIGSSLINETVAAGGSGDINIKTRALNIRDGASVATKTLSSNGIGGNININASESIEVSHYSLSDGGRTSNITALSASNANAGNVQLSTKLLTVLNSGTVASFTQGRGSSGNVDIKAEAIEISGVAPAGDRSTIASSSLGSGNAGKVTIDTVNLKVTNGASVSSSGFSNSSAGSVTINALNSVEVSGRASQTFSEIRSAIEVFASESARRILELPNIPQGNAGDVTINTPSLRVSNEAKVSVQNQGIGNGGILKLNADLLWLDHKGSIIANTKSGVGGEILIESRDIRLRNNSNIAATAQGNIGNGGNIRIDTNTLTALENSDISANAVASYGGKVIINAQGIFGTQFRQELTPKSDITASSRQGSLFKGVVDINSFNFDPSLGIVELPKTVLLFNDPITTGCPADGNKFVVTGRGGLPEDPTTALRGTTIWSDLRPRKGEETTRIDKIRQSSHFSKALTIIEATSWTKDASGVISLVAYPNAMISSWQQNANCSR